MPRLRLQTRVKRTVGAKKAAETGLALIDISTGAIEPNLSKSGPGPGSARSSAATTTGLLRIADASCAMANRAPTTDTGSTDPWDNSANTRRSHRVTQIPAPTGPDLTGSATALTLRSLRE
ncbi:hypothetical protein ACWGLG_40460 [Streptomyces antimycoticus]